MELGLTFKVTSTAAALGSMINLRGLSSATLVISGLTTETIGVTGLICSGTTASGPPAYTTAGVAGASSALGNGTFFFRDMSFDTLIFTKSAATESATLTCLVT